MTNLHPNPDIVRVTVLGGGGTGSGGPTTAAAVSLDTTNFNGNFDASILNVQLMADVLDDMTAGIGGITSINGDTGPVVVLTAASVGAVDLAAVGAPFGVASLDVDGKVPLSQLPPGGGGPDGITSINGDEGPIVVLTPDEVGAVDVDVVGVANGVASLDSTGKLPLSQLPSIVGTGAVDSVNGFTGVVTITPANIGAIATSAAGVANGVATLDSNGFVPDAQLDATIARTANVQLRTDYGAQSVLIAIADNDPQPVTIDTNHFVGRSTGNAGTLTPAEARSILDLDNLYVSNVAYTANSVLAATTAGVPVVVTMGEGTLLGRDIGGNITALDGTATTAMLGLTVGSAVQAWSPALDDLSAAAAASDSLDEFGLVLVTDTGNVSAQTVSPFMRSWLSNTTDTAALLALNGSPIGHHHDVADIDDLSTVIDSPSIVWVDDFSDPLNLTTTGNVVDDSHLHTGATVSLTAIDISVDSSGYTNSTGTDLAQVLADFDVAITTGGGGGGGAPTSADYYVGSPSGGLSAEIVIGTPSVDGQLLRRASGTPGWGALDLANGNSVTGVLPSANIDATVIRTSSIGVSGGVMGYDAGLAALAGFNTNGFIAQTANNTFAGRTLTGTANRLSVTNGAGTAGDPVFNIDPLYDGQTSIATLGTITTGVWNGTPISVAAGGTGVTGVGSANTVLASTGSAGAWVSDLALPSTVASNNVTGGKYSSGGGVHIKQVWTGSASPSGTGSLSYPHNEYLGSPFIAEISPTMTNGNAQTANGWFGPMAVYNVIGTTTYSANTTFDVIPPIAFGNFVQTRNNAGSARTIGPAWGIMSTPMFVADNATVTQSAGNDTSAGSASFVDTTTYVTNNGGHWNATVNDFTSYLSAHQSIGNVHFARVIGFDVRPQSPTDPLGAGPAGAATIFAGLPGYNVPLLDQVLPTFDEEIAFRSRRFLLGTKRTTLQADNSIRIYSDTVTHTVNPDPMIIFEGTQTLNFSAATISMLAATGTIIYSQQANPFGAAAAVAWSPTIKNSPSASGVLWQTMFPFTSSATITADTTTVSGTTLRQFHAGGTSSTVNGGHLRYTEHTGFASSPIVNNANVTVDVRQGFAVYEIGGSSGTITREVGVYIDPLTRGATNVGILNNNSLINTGTIYGSEATNGNLTFAASTAAEQGSIVVGIAGTNAAGNFSLLTAVSAYTMSASGGSGATGNGYVGFGHGPTLSYTTEANAFIGAVAFSDTSIYKGANGSSVDLHSVQSYIASPTLQADNGTVTGSHTGFTSSPTAINTLAGGTITLSALNSFSSTPAVRNGAVATTRTGLFVADVTLAGTGAVTTNIGVDIVAMTAGGTNWGIRCLTASVIGPTIHGSTSANGTLALSATSDAAKGGMTLDAAGVEWQASNLTVTTTPFASLFFDATTTMNVATGTYYGTRQNGTIIFQQDGNALGGAFGYVDNNTYKNLAAGSATPNVISSFQAVPTLNADNVAAAGTITIGQYAGLVAGVITSRTTAGALSVTNGYGVLVNAPSIGTATTMVTWTGFKYTDIAGAGTKTNQIAIDIPALSGATTLNIGIRSLATVNILAGLAGSGLASGNLNLKSTTDTTKGDIQLDNPSTEWIVTDFTATANPSTLLADATVTMDVANGTYRGIRHTPTVQYNQAGLGVGGAFGIADTATYKNVSGVTGANGTASVVSSIYSNPILTADNVGSSGTVTIAQFAALAGGVTTSRLTAGALSVTNGFGVLVNAPSIGLGTTMATWTGLKVSDIAGGGTKNTQIGIDLPLFAGATTNIGFRNASTMVYTPVTKTITATTDTIPINASIVLLNNTSGSSKTLAPAASGPIMADGQNGQVVKLINVGASDVVITDQATQAGSNVKTVGTAITLTTRDAVEFTYNTTTADWTQTSPVVVVT